MDYLDDYSSMPKQKTPEGKAKAMANLKPFTKNDPRINTKGAPKRSASYKHWLAELYENMLTKEDPKTGEPILAQILDGYLKDARTDARYRSAFVQNNWELITENLDSILQGQKQQDVNYLRYLIHLHLFDEQKNVLLSKKKEKILICGRRAGKTEDEAAMIADCAISHNEGTILYISITSSRAYELIWLRLVDLLDSVGIPYKAKLTPTPHIDFGTGVTLYIRGAGSKDELEKVRGEGYLLAIIDEVQSIKDDNMKYLINECLMPGLMQYQGTLVLAGTPPKIQGSFIEKEWNNEKKDIARFNWNITQNIYIKDSERSLEKIRLEQNLKETDSIYRREYLGEMGVYDLDALVYRLESTNYFTEIEFAQWIRQQPVTDVYLTGGLDFGWTDSDAFVIIAYSTFSHEKWLLYEYKKNKEMYADLAASVKKGMEYVANMPQLSNLVNKDYYIFADSADPKQIAELRSVYGLPVAPVKKGKVKDVSISRLQQEIRSGAFKIREGSIFEDEARQIIFKRDVSDNLTREIDDDFYHPDMADAILYALRQRWDQTTVS
jgi:hypothetical protein